MLNISSQNILMDAHKRVARQALPHALRKPYFGVAFTPMVQPEDRSDQLDVVLCSHALLQVVALQG
jgi:L-ascorbate metabolism protein UlaG (beta-lactamase superfamily)